jgi:hypothetical protein
MRKKIVLRVLLLLSPALLSGCGTIDLPSINLPWEDSTPKAPAILATTALRGDAGDTLATVNPPDGMQVEDLRAPFGTPPQTNASLTGTRGSL